MSDARLAALKSAVPQKRVNEWEEAFELFKGANNKIRKADLWLICRSVADIPSETELQEMQSKVQGDELDKDALLNLLTERFKASVEKEFEEVFKKVDSDGNGTIEIGELAEVMKNLGENFSEEELGAMIAAADYSKSGAITFEEFKSIIISG